MAWTLLLISVCRHTSNFKKSFSVEIFAPGCYPKEFAKSHTTTSDHILMEDKRDLQSHPCVPLHGLKTYFIMMLCENTGTQVKGFGCVSPMSCPRRTRTGLFPRELVCASLEHWLELYYLNEVVEIKQETRLPLWFVLVSTSIIYLEWKKCTERLKKKMVKERKRKTENNKMVAKHLADRVAGERSATLTWEEMNECPSAPDLPCCSY